MNNDFLPRRGFRHNDFPHDHDKAPLPSHAKQLHPHPDAFRTPDVITAHDEQEPETATAGAIIGHHQKPKKTLKERLKNITKKQWIIIGVVAAVLIGAGAFAVFTLLGDDPKPVVKKKEEKKQPAAEPVPLYSTLTGLPIADATVNDRPVTAIMIENSQDARPQSGLNQAGVVFEAVAEGGITRFLTLFQDSEPDYIGPVRSVRPYYVQWLMGFDAAVAHVGGSGEALAMIKNLKVKDLDQFANSSAYWRVSNRFAPHNMYTSIAKLREAENRKGYGKSTYDGFLRKEGTPSAAPTARTVDFNISGAIYNAHYDYDAVSNTYKRSEGGKPHTDEKSGAQLSPNVVIGLVMPQGKNGVYTTYTTIGSSQAFIFQDGIATPGTWEKASNTSQFVFRDATGKVIPLNRGQTWITVVGATNRITYQP